MCTIAIQALTPLNRTSRIKLYKNIARSRLFSRIAKRSIAPSESDEEEMLLGLHDTSKDQSKRYTGNFKDWKRKAELTEETTGATARPWKQAGGLPQDQKVVKEWPGKTNNGNVRRKIFELRPAAAGNTVNNTVKTRV